MAKHFWSFLGMLILIVTMFSGIGKLGVLIAFPLTIGAFYIIKKCFKKADELHEEDSSKASVGQPAAPQKDKSVQIQANNKDNIKIPKVTNEPITEPNKVIPNTVANPQVYAKDNNSNINPTKQVKYTKLEEKTNEDEELAFMYLENKQYEKAYKEYSILADNNNKNAQFMCGKMAFSGDHITADYDTAFKRFSACSDNNNIAKAYLALCYCFGLGTVASSENSLSNFKPLYEDNQPDIIYNLIEQCSEKEFFNPSVLYKLLSEIGDPKAMYELSKLDSTSPEEKLSLLETATSKGNLNALLDLAMAYRKGVIVERDDVKAAYLYKQGIKQNSDAAKFNYAQMLLKGLGVNQNFEEAIGLLKGINSKEANFQLSQIYFDKQYPQHNAGTAFQYLASAAEDGDQAAIDYMKQKNLVCGSCKDYAVSKKVCNADWRSSPLPGSPACIRYRSNKSF